MLNQSSREFYYFKVPVFFADLIIYTGVIYAFMHILPAEATIVLSESIGHLGLFALMLMSFSASVGIIGIRLHERKINLFTVIWRAFLQAFLTFMIFTSLVAMVYRVVPRYLIICSLGTCLVLIAVCHFLANYLVRLVRRNGHNIRNVAIIGADQVSQRLYRELRYGQVTTGYKIAGFFTSLETFDMPEDANYLGSVESFFDWIENNHIDEIYCSLPPHSCKDLVDSIVKVCNNKFIDFFYVPTMDGYPHRQMSFQNFGRVTIIKLRDEPMNSVMAKVVKRSFDILVSLGFLCTIYPFIFLFVWIGDLLTGSKGPVYFKQSRTGYNGKSFKIYKFRSMKVNAQADTLQATEDDPRKTKFGDFLRRSSIDEIPQLINVLKGDMSIVGPRPHMDYHTEVYSGLIDDYMVRHLAKPGITGWAQVSGCRGETKTVEEMKDRVEHDIWYIEHWTPLLDVEIILKTAWQVLPGHDKQAY